ncbi:MAG: sulfurtransferase TusA family protein [Methanobacteriota archaeon]
MAAPEKIVLDARGSFCPGPLMELIRGIRQAKVGEIVEVWSSDQGSREDIPFWVQKAGHELVGVVDEDPYTRFVVRKAR